MSTELKQAAQQAVDAFDAFGDDDDFESLFALAQKMNALRTAIQQAEAKTGEPVAWPLRAQVWKRESTQEWILEIAGTLGDTDMNIRHTQPLSVAYENVPGLPTFYNHPAPGVPDEVVRDAERYRWLRATTNWASSNGERIDVRNNPELWDSAIDAAMLAASPAQKGGE